MNFKPATDLLVVHDELELRLGESKVKHGGSARGHNGVKSVVSVCKYQSDFNRVLVGVDRPASRDAGVVAEYVLRKFKESEKKDLRLGLDRAADLVESWISDRLK